jgi:hypothetical protein
MGTCLLRKVYHLILVFRELEDRCYQKGLDRSLFLARPLVLKFQGSTDFRVRDEDEFPVLWVLELLLYSIPEQ